MRIKSMLLDKFSNFLKNNLDDITDEKLEISLYGMEVIISLVSKLLLYLIISLLFKCTYQYFIVILLLAIIRSTSAGFHANSEIMCYISSFLIIFGVIFISTNYNFSFCHKLIICIISLIITIIYAPADTEARPIVNKKIRGTLKFLSVFTCLLFSILSMNIFISIDKLFSFNNGFMSNAIICILAINSINISPILYKIFKRGYKNYEQY